jgi:ribosome-associated protein
MMDIESILQDVTAVLSEHKAEDITVIDLTKKASFAACMVVCSAKNSKQTVAIGQKIIEAMKNINILPRIEGVKTGDWVLVDIDGIIVHIMRPEIRELYNIEQIWQ